MVIRMYLKAHGLSLVQAPSKALGGSLVMLT